MALTQVDKMKIIKLFKETPFGEIYYEDIMNVISKKSKATDIELLTFFSNYVIENLKKDSPSLNLLKKMVSALSYFIELLSENNVEIDFDLKNRLYSVRECYEQFLVNGKLDRIKDFDDLIATFEEDLKKNYPATQGQDFNLDQFNEELAKLRRELREKEEEIKNLSLLCDKKDKLLVDKKKESIRLGNKLTNSENKNNELNSRIKGLEKVIVDLRDFIAVLEDRLKASDVKYDTLVDVKEKLQSEYFKIKSSLKILRSELEKREKELKQIHEDEKRQIKISLDRDGSSTSIIESLIFKKMAQGNVSIEELEQYLSSNGHFISRNEIIKYLISLKGKMELRTGELEESIETTEEENKYTIKVPGNCSSVDLLVVSDFHLTSFDKDVIQDLDLINDYCENNGIGTVINVGDFFALNRTRNKQSINICKKLVEKVVTKYPSRTGVVHAVMGGNHDKELMEYIDNPLKTLADERDDFINLGYSHCNISFSGAISILDTIGLHHFNRRFPEPVGEIYSTYNMCSSLSSYYKKGFRDKVYVDILGHIHKSGLDTENGICIVPSYRKDRVLNGAWHLKVYFGVDGHISNIVFLPIIKQKKLVPITEINYKKVLKKNL